jgi:hypothetical protein
MVGDHGRRHARIREHAVLDRVTEVDQLRRHGRRV